MEFNFLASFTEVLSYIGYILLAVLVLLIMITVHELGHYIAGKIFGFKINEFAIGFGPKIFKKTKKNGEIFSVRLLPIGGFCAFNGEDEDDADPASFNNKKPWQRIIVLISGALMNYILAVVCIIIMFSAYGQTALVPVKLTNDVNYPAEYSFQSKDIILEADGKNVYMISDLMGAVENKSKGDIVTFTIIRDGKEMEVPIMLRASTDFANVEDVPLLYTALGVSYEIDGKTGAVINGGLYSTNVRLGFFSTIGKSFEYSFKLGGTIFTVLGQLFTGRLGASALGGTVTTVALTANAIKNGGLVYLLNMSALIGVNLAVFNLLPVPALDGMRALFTLIEWISKKPISRKVENIIHAIGLVLLLIMAIVLDLQHCF